MVSLGTFPRNHHALGFRGVCCRVTATNTNIGIAKYMKNLSKSLSESNSGSTRWGERGPNHLSQYSNVKDSTGGSGWTSLPWQFVLGYILVLLLAKPKIYTSNSCSAGYLQNAIVSLLHHDICSRWETFSWDVLWLTHPEYTIGK